MPRGNKKKELKLRRATSEIKRAEPAKKEDLIGNFLVSVFNALITALLSLAVAGQINWLIVLAVFLVSLTFIAVYQRLR